jgi:predicted amidohydrolase
MGSSQTPPFTVALVQSATIQAEQRSDVKRNLARALEILDRVDMFSCTHRLLGAEGEQERWAPVRLVHFPESFLQGFFIDASGDLKRWRDEIAIDIPGEETDALAQVARQRNLYISGVARRRLERFPDHIFNCNFIIDPNGELIHQYHKFSTFMLEVSTSPHDIWQDYLAAFRRPGQSLRDVFFPVVKTPIGNIGTLICNDGMYAENWRALALGGAEIILCGNLCEPFVSPPRSWNETQAKAHAIGNLCYVGMACTGALLEGRFPSGLQPGDSMLVDPEGVVIARMPHPVESVVTGVVRIDHLRDRRRDDANNFLAQLRTEVYAEMYAESIYPAGWMDVPYGNVSDYQRRTPRRLGVMERLESRGVFASLPTSSAH